MAFRVPTSDVSVVDLTANLVKETTYEDICKEVQRRADGDMKGNWKSKVGTVNVERHHEMRAR